MRKIIYGTLIGLILAIVILSTGANTYGAPVLTYVYSNSMEPLIKVNEAFIVWPTSRLHVGDIVTYRPVVLKAPYITHRIIAFGETGFITKGDNSPYEDQESGEPEVQADRIIGKVVTIKGQPLIVPLVGSFSARVRSLAGGYAKYLSGIFFVLGIISLFAGNRRSARRPKPRRRLRLRHIYRGLVITAAGLVMISIYMGARVTQVKYLVSEYPGSLGDQVPLNQPGRLKMEVRNNGFVPVWTVVTGIPPLSVHAAPRYIPPRSAEAVVLDVVPQHETGIYQGYVQVYNYPVLLPRTWFLYLHRLSPVFAIAAAGLTLGLCFIIFFKVLEQVHGFEGWTPLKAIRDKIAKRRYRRARAKYLGRRRVR